MSSESGVMPNPIDWNAAFAQHSPWLRKVLACRVGDRHLVDDLLQEVAVAVFGKSPKPTHPDSVAPWLYRLAVRQSINYHRKANRKSTARAMADLDPEQNSDPLQWLLSQEKEAAMQRALKKLRPQEHEILTLKYTESWSYRQLAERLGVKEKTVEYRLLKARKRLRSLLLAEIRESGVND